MAFDVVHELQEVYRQVVQTMSRPGQIENIKNIANKSPFDCDGYQGTLLIAMMLLDGEVSFHVVSGGESKLADQIAELTLARKKDLQEADYVFVKSDIDAETFKEVLRQVKAGTLENPQTSATVIVEMKQHLSNDGPFILKGPGIENTAALSIGDGGNWLDDRAYVNREYPLGIDLILIDEIHNIASLPRTTQVEKKGV